MIDTWRARAKRHMKSKKLSQEALAERLDMTQGGVSSWLRGATQPSLDDINRIADEIGVSRVWLTHGLGPSDGPGKILVDLLLSGALTDADMPPLAATAQALVSARSGASMALRALSLPPAGESAELLKTKQTT